MSALSLDVISAPNFPGGKEHHLGTNLQPVNPDRLTQDISSLALPSLSSRPRTLSSTHDEETSPPPIYPPTAVAEVNPAITGAQVKVYRQQSHIHFAALCWFMLTQGWNDGTPGPFLPVMQGYYHVRFGSRLVRQRRYAELQLFGRLVLL